MYKYSSPVLRNALEAPLRDGLVDYTSLALTFNPLTVQDFILWMDASDEGTITTTGSFVDTCADKSGNGNTLTTIAGGRPVTGSETINGLNVFDFDGNDYLENTSLITVAGTVTTGFIVAQRDALDTNDRYLTVHDSGQTNDFDNNNSGILCANVANDTIDIFRNNVAVSSTTHPANDAPFLFVGEFDGTNGTAYLNGTAATSGSSTASFNYDSVYVGGGYTSGAVSDRIDGKIAEVLITTSALSTVNRQKIEGYLAHKWGLVANLPSTHPYKITPP